MNHLETIHRHIIARKLSIGTEIEKSHISTAFMHVRDQLKITKSGKDIKDVLKVAYAKYEIEKSECVKEIVALSKICIGTPTNEPYRYKITSTDFLPKMYDHESCNTSRWSDHERRYVDVEESERIAAENRTQYNSAVRDYLAIVEEMQIINTIKNSLEDNKKYELTLEQAIALGL